MTAGDDVVEARCGCWWPRGQRCANCSSCSACCRCIAMQVAAAYISVVEPADQELEDDDDAHRARLHRHAMLAAGYDAYIERWAQRATERLRRSR